MQPDRIASGDLMRFTQYSRFQEGWGSREEGNKLLRSITQNPKTYFNSPNILSMSIATTVSY